MDAVQAADHLVHVHSLYQAGHTLGISGASADEADIGQFIILYLKGDLAGADPFCLVRHGITSVESYRQLYGTAAFDEKV